MLQIREQQRVAWARSVEAQCAKAVARHSEVARLMRQTKFRISSLGHLFLTVSGPRYLKRTNFPIFAGWLQSRREHRKPSKNSGGKMANPRHSMRIDIRHIFFEGASGVL